MGRSDQIGTGRILPSALRRLRARATDVGATFVEYALVFSVLAVVSIPAAQWLTDESRDQVANEADCISMRPPPPGCQIPAVETTTSTVPVSIPTTTGGDPSSTTTEPPSTTTRPPGSGSWLPGAVATPNGDGSWTISASIQVQNAEGPIAGAFVQVRIQNTVPSGGTFYSNCSTGPAGTCAVSWVVEPSVSQAQLSVTQINSNPPTPVGSYPLPLNYTRP